MSRRRQSLTLGLEAQEAVFALLTNIGEITRSGTPAECRKAAIAAQIVGCILDALSPEEREPPRPHPLHRVVVDHRPATDPVRTRVIDLLLEELEHAVARMDALFREPRQAGRRQRVGATDEIRHLIDRLAEYGVRARMAPVDSVTTGDATEQPRKPTTRVVDVKLSPAAPRVVIRAASAGRPQDA